MRRRTKAGVALGVFAGAVGGLWFAAPSILKWKIHERYPDVAVGDVQIGWKIVHLHDVTFDRKWLKGTFPAVTVTWDEAVDVEGGRLDVDLDAKPRGAGSGEAGHTITFRNLSVHVTKGQVVADLEGVNGEKATTICWASGTVRHPRAEASFHSGCADRDGSQAYFEETVSLRALDVPHVPKGTVLGLAAVAYSNHVLTAETATGVLELAAGKTAQFTAVGMHFDVPDPPYSTWGVGMDRITVDHPWISAGPVTFQNVTAYPGEAHGVWDSASPWIHIEVNGAELDVNPGGLAIRGQAPGAIGLPCQTWVDALPDELRVKPLQALKFSGNFSWGIDLKAVGTDGKPKPKIDFAACRVPPTACGPIKALRRPFTYWVYKPDGSRVERRTGPGTAGWVPLASTGPMETAVVNTEDYGFRKHGGFLPAAYYGALVLDLAAGDFVRGGSTITMQLAKNLWLRRSKTLGRKVQEMFLSMALDSCLTKDEIMETYLNVIEFGPMIYGIQAGSAHWFHKPPAVLEPVEAFWLAGILPAPRKATPPTTEALARTQRLMERLASMGRDVGPLAVDGPEEPETP